MKKYFLLCLVLLTSGIANAANQNDKVNGTPGNGLTIYNSDGVALDEKQEDTIGAFVPINNDNDDYDFKGGPMYSSLSENLDSDDLDGVEGENDLIHFRIEADNTSPMKNYYLNYRVDEGRRIQVWSTANKAPNTRIWSDEDKNASHTAQIFDSTQSYDLYIEGLADQKTIKDTDLENDYIQLRYKNSIGRPVIVDSFPVYLYRVIGANYVPENSSYVYRAYTSRGTPVSWSQKDGSGLEDVVGKTDRKRYSWGAGPAKGYVVVSPADGFKCEREVYIVKIEFDVNQTESIIEVNNGYSVQRNDLKQVGNGRFVRSSNSSTKPAMKALCKVKFITGYAPQDDQNAPERGVRFIEIGLIQIVSIEKWNGDYRVGTQSKKRTANHQGKDFLDGNLSGNTWPWYDRINTYSNETLESTHKFEDALPDEDRIFQLGMMDTPDIPVVDKLVLDYDKGEQNVSNVEVSKFNLLLKFKVYASAMTIQLPSTGDSSMYSSDDLISADRKNNFPQTVVSDWSFNGSGNISPTLTWTSDDMNNVMITSKKFVAETATSRVPLTDDTTNRFANVAAANPIFSW